jgi:hypothetical protein
MSSLWTPGGEHPVDRESPGAGGDAGEQAPRRPPAASRPRSPAAPADPGAAEAAAAIDELRRQLTESPPEVVVANHAYGMFELGAIYLSQNPPLLDGARLAIDAMGALVDGLEGRLGENEASLRDALAQIRLAFVQLEAAARAGDAAPSSGNGAVETDD